MLENILFNAAILIAHLISASANSIGAKDTHSPRPASSCSKGAMRRMAMIYLHNSCRIAFSLSSAIAVVSLPRLVMYLINDGLVVLMESVCGRINPFGRRLSSVFCPPRCMKGQEMLCSRVLPLFFYWPLVVWFNCSCLLSKRRVHTGRTLLGLPFGSRTNLKAPTQVLALWLTHRATCFKQSPMRLVDLNVYSICTRKGAVWS